MSHRAFVFDETSYRGSLRAALFAALEDGEPEALETFASGNVPDVEIRQGTIALAEKALELYYDPSSDIGLGTSVRQAREALDQAYPEGIAFLTGSILPLHGWYVQSAEAVARNLPLVEQAAHQNALRHEVLMQVAGMLRAGLGKGLLVKS